MMNRRFRAGELSLHEVAANVAPFRPHVEASPGVSPPSASGDKSSGELDARRNPPGGVTNHRTVVKGTPGKPGGTALEVRRRIAYEHLHTYISQAVGHDPNLLIPIFNRITTALEFQLAPARGERSRPQ